MFDERYSKEAQLTRKVQLQASSLVATGRSSRLCGGETYMRCVSVIPSQAGQNLKTGDQGVQAVLPSLCATTLHPVIPNKTTHPILFSMAMSPRLSEHCHSITDSPHNHNTSTPTPSSANVPTLQTTSPLYWQCPHLPTVSLHMSLLVLAKVHKVAVTAHSVYMHIHIKSAMVDHCQALHAGRHTMWMQTLHHNCVGQHQSHLSCSQTNHNSRLG